LPSSSSIDGDNLVSNTRGEVRCSRETNLIIVVDRVTNVVDLVVNVATSLAELIFTRRNNDGPHLSGQPFPIQMKGGWWMELWFGRRRKPLEGRERDRPPVDSSLRRTNWRPTGSWLASGLTDASTVRQVGPCRVNPPRKARAQGDDGFVGGCGGGGGGGCLMDAPSLLLRASRRWCFKVS
jgi:hypothetical protein